MAATDMGSESEHEACKANGRRCKPAIAHWVRQSTDRIGRGDIDEEDAESERGIGHPGASEGKAVFQARSEAPQQLAEEHAAWPALPCSGAKSEGREVEVWGRDVIWYTVFFMTSLVMYCTDTLFWALILACALGPVIALYLRGEANVVTVCSDKVQGISAHFQNKVLYYLTGEANREGWNKANAFAVMWNRVIDVMYHENKLSNAEKAHWKLNMDPGAPRRARDDMDLRVDAGPLNYQPLLLHYLTRELPCQRLPTVDDWPKVPEVQWAFEAMSRALSLEMPRPYRVPYIPRWTTRVFEEMSLALSLEMPRPYRVPYILRWTTIPRHAEDIVRSGESRSRVPYMPKRATIPHHAEDIVRSGETLYHVKLVVFTPCGRELRGQAALLEHTGRKIKQAEYLYLGKQMRAGRSSRREAKPRSSWPRSMLPGRPSHAAGPRGARGR